MHILIHILLSADTKAMAITHAQFTLDNLIEAGHYDYYNIGIESRWPDIPIAVGAHTRQGNALLENAIQATMNEFLHHLSLIRNAIEKFDELELYNAQPDNTQDPNQYCSMFRFHCHQLGQTYGSSVRLFDNNGNAIHNQRELQELLCANNMWVVSADVHI